MPNIGVAKAKKDRSRHPKLRRAGFILLALLILAVVGLSMIPDPDLELAREKALQGDQGAALPKSSDQAGSNELPALTIIHNQIDQSDALESYASSWAKAKGSQSQISVVSGGTDYSDELNRLKADDQVPDLIYFDSKADLLSWQDDLADLSQEAWVQDTSFAFKDEALHVIGFPVSIEGYGLIYNQDILLAAGIDPAQINNFPALQAAVTTLAKQRDKLGLQSIFAYSLADAQGMTWTNSVKLFNVYLSEGLSYDNRLMIDSYLAGSVAEDRLNQFAKLVELLVNQTNQDLLTTGSYTDQIDLFAQGKAAFLIESAQLEYALQQQNASFQMGFLPIPAFLPATPGVFAKAGGWFGINRNSPNQAQARQFLNDLHQTAEGNDYLINQAHVVPAFKTLIVKPQTPLAVSLWNWVATDEVYSIWQDELPSAWVSDVLMPAFMEFSQGQLNQSTFTNRLKIGIQALNPDAKPGSTGKTPEASEPVKESSTAETTAAAVA